MKPKDISDALGALKEETVAEADQIRGGNASRRRNHMTKWIGIGVAAAACIALAAVGIWKAGLFGSGTDTIEGDPSSATKVTGDALVLAFAEYPAEIQYPEIADDDAWTEWREQVNEKSQLETDTERLVSFFTDSTKVFLSDTGDENRVYSPLNTYFALAMLAESTAGTSQSQILDLLGSADTESLREQAKALWNKNYADDGINTSIFADSLWLNQDLVFNQETIDAIAANYYASVFSGVVGSEDYNNMLKDWVNKQTGNLLEESVDSLNMEEGTIMEILSTSLFKASWSDTFYDGNNTEGTFHGAAGDTDVTFMNRSDVSSYVYGDNFSAASLSLRYSGSMMFILPDEGTSVDEILESDLLTKLFTCLCGDSTYDDVGISSEMKEIYYSIPKFDVSAQFDMLEGLADLGVTEVQDAFAADFSALLDVAPGEAVLSRAKQAARVTIDEEGVTAASYVDMGIVETAAMIADRVDFTVDRPFIFIITGVGDTPLYVGVVNQIG